MNGYSLRGITTGLMTAATLLVYLAGLLCCGAELGLRLYHVGYLEPFWETFDALAIAVGRPALGWLVAMTVLFPVWAICPAGNPSLQQSRQDE